MILTLSLTVGPPILGDKAREERYIADQLIQVANEILKGGRAGATHRNSKKVCTWTIQGGTRLGASSHDR